MKCCLFCFVSSVSLHFLTNHLNRRSNMPLDMAPTEYVTYNFIKYITFNFIKMIHPFVVCHINNL